MVCLAVVEAADLCSWRREDRKENADVGHAAAVGAAVVERKEGAYFEV